jgi:uncharacterized protein
VSLTDEELVERQIGRRPRAFRRVAVRCPFGRPAVTEQAPFDADGRPFPTQFYVTCPQLVAAISRLEAAGGVERWSQAARDDEVLARSLADAQAEQRELRPEIDAGIGGSTRGGSLKCLHAHAAFALARPGYELGDRILNELPALWPPSCCTHGAMDVELARQHWQDGNRRIEEARTDPQRYRALVAQVELLVARLRQRVGQTFTLADLAASYDGADDWARELLDEADPEGPVPSEPGTVADAAFHAYARGALDYRP